MTIKSIKDQINTLAICSTQQLVFEAALFQVYKTDFR